MIAFCRWSSVPRLRGVCARHQRVQASCALLLPFGCPPNALYYNDLIGDKLPEGPAPDATCRVGATIPGAAIATRRIRHHRGMRRRPMSVPFC